jgi:hypothetical protein
MGVGDLAFGKAGKLLVRQQHGVDGVGKHHAGGCVIREHRIFLPADTLVKGHRLGEIVDGQIDEYQALHHFTFFGRPNADPDLTQGQVKAVAQLEVVIPK